MLKVMCVLNDHQFPLFRRDRNRNGGIIRKETVTKRLTKFETFEQYA